MKGTKKNSNWKRRLLWVALLVVLLTGVGIFLIFNRFHFSNQDFPSLASWQGNDKFSQNDDGERPQIIGHRGAGFPAIKDGQRLGRDGRALADKTSPLLIGNTAAAIQRGIEADLDWIEIDIRLSGDNELMVFHDESIDLKTTSKGRIEDLGKEAIQKVQVLVNPPERILTLDEVFNRFHSDERKWVFDIKAVGIQTEVLRWIEAKVSAGELLKDQLILFGRHEVLVDYKDSGYKLGYTVTWGAKEGVLNRLRALFTPSQIISRCEDLDCSLLVLPTIFAHQSLVKAASSKGIGVWVYGSDNEVDHRHFAGRAISGLIVDDPEVAMTCFKGKSPMAGPFRNEKDQVEWGFKDVVKNPDYLAEVGQGMQAADEAAGAAQNWSDEKVAAATRHFILEVSTGREAWEEARILQSLQRRAHPAVLELLGEVNLYDRLVKPTGDDLGPEAPFNRACDLLGDAPPREAVGLLAPFLNDRSEEIRKDAVLAIAKTGTEEIIPYVRKAFADSDEYVRSYALMGIEFALERDGLAEAVPAMLFDSVKDLLEKGRNADKAVGVLFRFNSGKAKDYFLSDKVFGPDSEIIYSVLSTLSSAGVSVPRERLLKLISAFDAGELKYPRSYALGGALRLLGQMNNPGDRDLLLSRLTHADEQVAQGAAAGLLCLSGLEGFEQRIWNSENKSGYESLPEHQRFYSAVFMCDAEINNGGLAQYFMNSSGDHWRDGVAGLEAMGFQERLDVLKEAIALFGADGPSDDREKRHIQLSKLYKKNDAIFDELESRYYGSSEVVEVVATRFVLANPDSFR